MRKMTVVVLLGCMMAVGNSFATEIGDIHRQNNKYALDLIKYGKYYYNHRDYENALKYFQYAEIFCEQNKIEGLKLVAEKWLNSISDREVEKLELIKTHKELEKFYSPEEVRKRQNTKIVNLINKPHSAYSYFWSGSSPDDWDYASLSRVGVRTCQITEQYNRIYWEGIVRNEKFYMCPYGSFGDTWYTYEKIDITNEN